MTVVLINTWVITFLLLGTLYCIEGWDDPDHWEEDTLYPTLLLSLTPVVAQLMLLGSLWEYGKYYTLKVYHTLKSKL